MNKELHILSPDIHELAHELTELYEKKYQLIKPQVESIIVRRIKEPSFIESYLDKCMDLPTDKGYKLFSRLCKYYSTINLEAAWDYARIYSAMYGEEEEKSNTKKKKL